MNAAGIELVVLPDADAVADEAARRVAGILRGRLAHDDVASIVLAGGSTGARFHRALARPEHAQGIDWTRMHVFFGDERAVPPADPASNFGAASRDLLEPVGIPSPNVHRMAGEADPESAARDYELQLARWLASHGRLDVALLGVGEDGHTASLFPGDASLRETERLCLVTRSPRPPHARITLTYPAFARALHILVLVHGRKKRAVVARSLDQRGPDFTPAARALSATGAATWIVDRAAVAD